MKLYIASQTCSLTVQIVANELGLSPGLVHYNVFDKTTSSNETFADINALSYVPVLVLDNQQDRISETIVVASYLADQFPSGTCGKTQLHPRHRG